VVLLAAQFLGQVHGVLHTPQHLQTSAQGPLSADHRQAHPGDGHDGHTHGGLLSLFDAHEDGDADCRLYDALSHTDLLALLPMQALPVGGIVALVRRTHGDFVARWAAFFDARGPPALG
jgi:hypothetical protein